MQIHKKDFYSSLKKNYTDLLNIKKFLKLILKSNSFRNILDYNIRHTRMLEVIINI